MSQRPQVRTGPTARRDEPVPERPADLLPDPGQEQDEGQRLTEVEGDRGAFSGQLRLPGPADALVVVVAAIFASSAPRDDGHAHVQRAQRFVREAGEQLGVKF